MSGGVDIWHLYTWLGDDLGLFFNGVSKGNLNNGDGSYSIASDRRLKKYIITRNGLLSDVMQMRVTEFHYKDQSIPKEIGFIAQEVLLLFPHLINHLLSLLCHGLCRYECANHWRHSGTTTNHF